MNSDQKLQTFAEKEIQRNLHTSIFSSDTGDHVIFGTYYLSEQPQGACLYNRSDDLIAIFSNKRTALSYCVADKYRQLNLSIQIKNLDQKKQQLNNDIQCQRYLASKAHTAEFREVVNTKLVPKITQYQAVCNELEKCVNSAKYLQIKGFQNETARVFSN